MVAGSAMSDRARGVHLPRRTWGPAAIALPVVLGTPWLRAWLESSMPLHMLVQMPLLVLAGFAGTTALSAARRGAIMGAVGGVVPCLLVASLASMLWMIPRALDLALTEPAVEIAKFVTLPLLVGAPLALAWPQLGLLGRGFVWTNLASMLAVLGWLYRVAPLRACNAYRLSEQHETGEWLIFVAIVAFVAWLATLFAPPSKSPTR